MECCLPGKCFLYVEDTLRLIAKVGRASVMAANADGVAVCAFWMHRSPPPLLRCTLSPGPEYCLVPSVGSMHDHPVLRHVTISVGTGGQEYPQDHFCP